ncbi:MAG: LPS translocon maturation chaperone LptM [Panacagrimonas sp.]
MLSMRFAFCSLILLLAACGQSGDLYRPGSAPTPKPVPVPVVVPPSEAPNAEDEDAESTVPDQASPPAQP